MTIFDSIWGPLTVDDWIADLLASQPVQTEVARLQRLRHLGLIAAEFSGAGYSEWEHHLGMYRLAQLASLNSEAKRRTLMLALFEGFGRLPYGYATERAVLRACKLSRPFHDRLRGILEEVAEIISRHRRNFDGRARLDDMINRQQYKDLYRWLSAVKLKALPRTVPLGHRQRLLYELVAAEGVFTFCNAIRQLDYVHRDLHYTGMASFRLSPHALQDFLTRRYGTGAQLLGSLRTFLNDAVYLRANTCGREHALTVDVAEMIANDPEILTSLLSMNDADFEECLKQRGYRIAEVRSREFIRVASDTLLSRYDESTDVSAVVDRVDSKWSGGRCAVNLTTGGQVRVDVLAEPAESRSAVELAKALCRLSAESVHSTAWMRKPLEVRGYGQNLLSYILNAEATCNYISMAATLLGAIWTADEADREVIVREITKWSGKHHLMLEMDLALASWGPNDGVSKFREVVMRALSRSDLSHCLKSVRRELVASMRSGKWRPPIYDPARRVELTAWLYSTLASAGRVAWVLPDVRDQAATFQVDVVEMEVADEFVKVTLIECSKSDSDTKANSDRKKLERISTLLSENNDDVLVEIVTVGQGANAVHEEILLELLESSQAELPSWGLVAGL